MVRHRPFDRVFFRGFPALGNNKEKACIRDPLCQYKVRQNSFLGLVSKGSRAGKEKNMKSEVFDIKRINQSTVGLLKGPGGERSEPQGPERSPTVAPLPPTSPPDPEVPAHPKRKQHSKAFKLRILKEADAANLGDIGALLRREGLYSSNLTAWRRQRAEGKLSPLSTNKRGPVPKMDEPTRREVSNLEKENSRLSRRLKRAEQIIEVQKKISELLGIPTNPQLNGEDD